jgi:hypothetical protein
MNKPLKKALSALLLMNLASAAGPSLAQANASGPPNGLNVNVLNTPLPVTGTVSGQVSVVGMPNVVVTNTAATAVPTRDLNSPARQPYMFFGSCESTSSNSCQIKTAPVPAGKRLVLQQVNGSMQLFGTALPQAFTVFLSGGGYLSTLPRPISSFSGLSNFSINETVLAYVDAGQNITVQPSCFNGFSIIASTMLSGYLIDAN